jgi:hypothetical protein
MGKGFLAAADKSFSLGAARYFITAKSNRVRERFALTQQRVGMEPPGLHGEDWHARSGCDS